MQENIIQKFRELYQGFTLKSMAEITGIQVTRLFRILNGAEMKLIEYQKFQMAILKMRSEVAFNIDPSRDDIFELTEMFMNRVSNESIQELSEFLRTRITSNEHLLTAT